MNEYLVLGHMLEIQENPLDKRTAYYSPHHPVIKETSLTTKLRVVFDGSPKTSNGVSLNDLQYVGPVVQDDLLSILLRFRQHLYVITADIEKMYRQISLVAADRGLHRLFWRSDPSKKLVCYELQTVTYGTASASFLATRCLKQLAVEYKEEHPLISSIIEHDFYVDDLLTGSDSTENIKVKIRIFSTKMEI